ncbi:hypothetical protein K9K77_03390 [Candidatus Babeliales bacterium]|nr:hypothetical protein [Candidatus Babeliales bacterium]
MKKHIALLFVLTLFQTTIHTIPNAFCCVPVADLIGTSMKEMRTKKSPIQSYSDMPFYDIGFLCPRISQLLFNEQVELLEEQGDEVKISISHFYYKTSVNNLKHTTYWTQKKNIMKFSDISKQDLSCIPEVPCFMKKTVPLKNIITLVLPSKNTKTNTLFSAGTRFVKSNNQLRPHYITVECFNPTTKKCEPFIISEKACDWGLPCSDQGKRRVFVSQLQSWAHPVCGHIPYVLGGASIQTFYTSSDFTCSEFMYKNKKKKFYYRKKEDTTAPCTGIDCAQLITRAAHRAGIPFFAKNTSTMLQDLQPVTKNDTIENGDIIAWKGHVAVITDVEKGLLVESRAYSHGYGIVHEIPFSEQFEGISSLQQLKTAYFEKKQISRLNKAGKKVGTISNIQIMKLPLS